MSNIISEITKLTEEWYKLAGRDHHKDRDCHWYINTVWSYGDKPYYRIEHYGYLLNDIHEKLKTYDEALARLKEILIESIEDAKTWEFV